MKKRIYKIPVPQEKQTANTGSKNFRISKELFRGEKIFNEQKIKDKIKRDFCKNNNIKFLEVSYNDNIRKKIYNILLNEDIV